MLCHSAALRLPQAAVPAAPLRFSVSSVPHRNHAAEEWSGSFEDLVLRDSDSAAVTESKHEQELLSPCPLDVMEDIVREMEGENFSQVAFQDEAEAGPDAEVPESCATSTFPYPSDDDEDTFENKRKHLEHP